MDDELTYEVRYVVSKEGKIKQANKIGQDFIKENGDMIYNHFTPSHHSLVRDMLSKYSEHQTLPEQMLYQKGEDGIRLYKYKGKVCSEGILLVGTEAFEPSKEKDKALPADLQLQVGEGIFNTLSIAVLALDHQNNVVYFNDIWRKKGHPLKSRLDKGKHPITNVIGEMARDIRSSGKDVRRYHLYDNKLFNVYGLYNEETEMIIFIIDDRAASDDYDNLLIHKQQMESVSQLAAGFAHELRNPLSVIRGFIQLSRLTNNIPKYYETIISEIDRMNDIVEDFLSLSRKPSEKELYQPKEFFESMITLIRSECLLRNIRLEYDFEEMDCRLLLNRSQIKQVFLNLLRNSIEAFDSEQVDKCFRLTGTVKEEGYHVMVHDNGPGMEKEVLDQLGKPFFTTKGKKGTGIGVPLCKKIIEEHQGRFGIESALGKGTTIHLVFPFEACD